MSHNRPERPPREFHHIKAIKEETIEVKLPADSLEKLLRSGEVPVHTMLKGIQSRLKLDWGLSTYSYIGKDGIWYENEGARWDRNIRPATKSETNILENLERLDQLFLEKKLKND